MGKLSYLSMMERKVDFAVGTHVGSIPEESPGMQPSSQKPPDVLDADKFVDARPTGLMDALTRPPMPKERPVVDSSGLEKWRVFSSFKDFYHLGDGRILAVGKHVGGDKEERGSSSELSQLEKEFGYYKALQAQGLPTPDPEMVMVQHGERLTPGMAMMRMPGTSVDFHKDLSEESVTSILAASLLPPEVLAERGIRLADLGTEMGLVRMMSKLPEDFDDPAIDENKKFELASGLAKILAAGKKGFSICDLQGIVGPDGRLTIIDPIYAGPFSSLNKEAQGPVRETYAKVDGILTNLLKGLTPTHRAAIEAELNPARM